MKDNTPKSLKLLEFLKKFLIAYVFLTGLVPVLNWSQDVLGIGNTGLGTSFSTSLSGYLKNFWLWSTRNGMVS